jgi:hypothetical protein
MASAIFSYFIFQSESYLIKDNKYICVHVYVYMYFLLYKDNKYICVHVFLVVQKT